MANKPKKPWAGRFKSKTARSVEDFTESVSFDRRLWPYDIMGSIAHARMLGATGIIAKRDSAAIIKGLKEIASECSAGKFRFKQSLEDVHMNIEAALIKKVGPVGGKLHAGRSRNDQVALDMRLFLRAEIGEADGLLAGLQGALLTLAHKNSSILMPGYTHLQRAQPVLLAHHLLAYFDMFSRDRARLGDCLKRTGVMPLGSAALAGTSLPLDRKMVARELGFKSVSTNSMDAVSDRDFVVEFTAAASLVMAHLSRLSEELVLWSTEEFSFIRLPDAFATGSSIMPQKKNPDVPELVRGKAGRVYGNLVALLTILKGLPLAYNRDMQEDKPPLFDTVDTLKASLAVMADMLPALKFNPKAMAAAAGGGFATATDVAEYLVLKGMPFREAHEVTGRMVSHCESKGIALGDLKPSDLKGFSKLLGKDILKRLDARSSVLAKRTEGGTSPALVLRRIKSLRKQLKK